VIKDVTFIPWSVPLFSGVLLKAHGRNSSIQGSSLLGVPTRLADILGRHGFPKKGTRMQGFQDREKDQAGEGKRTAPQSPSLDDW